MISEAEDAVPDRQTLQESLAQFPEAVKRLADRFARADLVIQPKATEGWSFLEQVCHLRDIETEGYSRRIRRILEEEDPLLIDIDGAKLAAERNYLSQDFDTALAALTRERKGNLEAIRRLSAEQFTRKARFGDSGPITLLDLLQMMVAHDREHLADLENLSESLASPQR